MVGSSSMCSTNGNLFGFGIKCFATNLDKVNLFCLFSLLSVTLIAL